jgi:tRNA(Ile)-lysidine synthase
MHGRIKVRSRRQGDAFQPLGMPGRKKLQDFFVDEKIPRLERDEIPLLTVDEEIAWVIGQRTADPFKVTGGTREVLRIEFSPL